MDGGRVNGINIFLAMEAGIGMEKIKEWFSKHKYAGGLIIAFPIVFIFYYFFGRSGTAETGSMSYTPSTTAGNSAGGNSGISEDAKTCKKSKTPHNKKI